MMHLVNLRPRLSKKQLPIRGLELVTVQRFQTTDTDFQSQATNAIGLDPDLVIISGLAADGGNLVKQLRELGYEGLIIGGNGLNTSNLFPVCKALCDGILIAQAYSPELDNEINQAFRAAYKAKTQQEPPQFSAQAFTGVQVFVEALRTVNQVTPIADLPLPELRTKLRDAIFAGTYKPLWVKFHLPMRGNCAAAILCRRDRNE
jgi:branched-chain amino acid transport system substrate-binding protein